MLFDPQLQAMMLDFADIDEHDEEVGSKECFHPVQFERDWQ